MEEFRASVLKGDYERAMEQFTTDIPEGANVLHVAAMMGYVDCVSHLMDRQEFDLNSKDSSDWLPLMHAIANNHRGVASMLIPSCKCNVNHTDTFKQTCLHIEAQAPSPSTDVAELLLIHGAIIDGEDAEGMTPFLRAIESHNVIVAEFLYAKGSNVLTCTYNGQCALHIASYHHFTDLVLWLLKIGCSVKVFDNNFKTPLMLCLQRKQQPRRVLHIMNILLEAGSDVNFQDCHGNTALLLALGNPGVLKKEHIELLLRFGADPNIPNRAGLTAIWQAIYDQLHYPDRMQIIYLLLYQNCYLDMSCRGKLLFTSGVDSVYCYETFMSPLEVALESGFHEAARMLVMAGCIVRPNLRCDMAASVTPAELIWFQHALSNPLSLQQQSRLVIRKVLGETILANISKLPLPEKLKDYVLLRDLFTVGN